jgi:GNAT superfamily N-acetyltransferase
MSGGYQIRKIDGRDEENTDMLSDLHRLTFFSGAPIPDFECGDWWLTYQDGISVAFAGMVPSTHVRKAGYISRVGVLSQNRGHGLQLRLMRVMESWARRCGWSSIVSDTTENLASANNFIRAGFRLYEPQFPWAWPNTLYWRKIIG